MVDFILDLNTEVLMVKICFEKLKSYFNLKPQNKWKLSEIQDQKNCIHINRKMVHILWKFNLSTITVHKKKKQKFEKIKAVCVVLFVVLTLFPSSFKLFKKLKGMSKNYLLNASTRQYFLPETIPEFDSYTRTKKKKKKSIHCEVKPMHSSLRSEYKISTKFNCEFP